VSILCRTYLGVLSTYERKGKTMIKTRARNDEEKAEKAQLIIDAAAKILKTEKYNELTTLDVTNEAGVSNGTLFVYFKTKEALFYHVLIREYIQRHNDYYNMLQLIDIPDFAMFKKIVLTEMEDAYNTRPVLMQLAPIRTTILENNVTPELIASTKKELHAVIVKTAEAIAAKFDALTADEILHIFTSLSAISIGFMMMLANPTKAEDPQENKAIYKAPYIKPAIDCMSTYLDGFEIEKWGNK